MRLYKRSPFSAPYLVPICVITLILARLTFADEYKITRAKDTGKNAQTLSLDAAVSEAIANNPLLKAAREEKKAKKSRILQSGALPDPALEVNLSNYPVSSVSARQSEMTGNEVMLIQKFPFPGKRDRLSDIAAFDFESSKDDLEKTKLNLIGTVKARYFDLFLSYKNREILQKQLELLHNLESLVTNKYSLGLVPQTDVLDLKVRNATLLIQIEKVAKEISVARAELNHLLGRHAHLAEWKPLAVTLSRVELPTNLEELERENTAQTSPQVKSLKSLLKSAESKVAYADLNAYPDFEIGVGYMQRFSTREDQGEDFLSARMSIDLPFFQRTTRREEQREARAEREKRAAMLKEGTLEISHALHETIAELTEAKNKIALYKRALLPLTDASIDSARKSYEANKTSYLTVLNLIYARFSSESEYYSAVVQHERGLAMFEALTGISLSDFNAKGR